jgi:Inner membrane component domain
VPPHIWRDSRECAEIQQSAYFAKACAQVVQLRRELAAAGDYERLSTRAGELRKGLAAAPIVATADPLPAAFSATLGRVLPIGGTEGVALLLTIVVEIMSCFGLAGLSALRNSRDQHPPSGTPAKASLVVPVHEGANGLGAFPPTAQQTLPADEGHLSCYSGTRPFVATRSATGRLVAGARTCSGRHLLAITIIGIPSAWAHLKLAGIALWPIGKIIVPALDAPLRYPQPK